MRRFGIAVVATALVPALLAAQTDSSRMRDSSRRAGRQQQTSSGAIANNSMRTSRLNHDQVTQLQTALQNMGCDPGSVDGVMGTHTRGAMSCARQKNNITSNDPQALYQSLNLNFASDTGAMNGRRSSGTRSASSNSGTMTNGTTGGATGKARGTRTRRMRGDSTRRNSTTHPDSTRRP